MKIISIGGGASSMMFSTQYKKNNPNDEIIVFEKSEYVSWAGCPTPYYIMDELPLKKATGESADVFINRGIDIKINTFVSKINFDEKYVIANDEKYYYDKLILGLGGKSNFKIEKNNYFSLNHVDDAIKIKEFIKNNKPQKALILGLGFIGLEMCEAFSKLGIKTTIIERENDIFPILPNKFKDKINEELKKDEVSILLNSSVKEFEENFVILNDNTKVEFDILLFSTGITANIDILENMVETKNGKILVNNNFETNIKDVYAIGDCIYNKNIITNEYIYAPFGDVANKHGLMLAKHLSNKENNFKGVIRSFASSYRNLKFAGTGLTLKEAINLGYNAESVNMEVLTKNSGFEDFKAGLGEIIYDKDTNTVLGGFFIGYEAIAQFCDQVAIVITTKTKIDEFINIDFAYSPTNASVWNPLLVLYRKVIK